MVVDESFAGGDMQIIKRFMEYHPSVPKCAFMLAIIAIVVTAATLGTTISDVFDNISTNLFSL